MTIKGRCARLEAVLAVDDRLFSLLVDRQNGVGHLMADLS